MSTLTTKFGLGQRVWKVCSTTETIQLPCRFCRGRGWLDTKGANEESRQVPCPECNGHAVVNLGSWPEWRVESDPLQIAMIRLAVFDRSGADNGERWDNRNPASVARLHEHDEENYMAWSTGVGSGTVHHAEDLFAAREEAEEEAERRTEKARNGEEAGGRKGYSRQWWPNAEQVRIAAGFLDHRDIYEHTAAHVALAQAICETAAKRAEVIAS